MRGRSRRAAAGEGGARAPPGLLETADDVGFVLNLRHGCLGPNDHVPHALAGDAVILGNFGQGEVFIIIEVEKLLLPLGQELPVEVVEHRHPVGLILHKEAPFRRVKPSRFTTLLSLQENRRNVKGKIARRRTCLFGRKLLY